MRKPKISATTALLASLLCASSCYEDYIADYDVQGVCFANPVDVRSVVVGEGMEFSTAVVMGGVVSNDRDRQIGFCTDMSLIDGEALEAMKANTMTYMQQQTRDIDELMLLPASQYTISTGSDASGIVIIRKGDIFGRIRIKMDSAAFLSAAKDPLPRCCLPLRITDTGSLSPIEGMQTTVIGVHYESMLFGNWWHGGVCTDDEGNVLSSYPLSIPQSDSQVWTLTTLSPFSLSANGIAGNLTGSKAQMKLTLNEDGTVGIEAVPGADFQVEPDGISSFKAGRLQERKLFLNYRFTLDTGTVCHARDTLIFRNRLRDGVNEWQ